MCHFKNLTTFFIEKNSFLNLTPPQNEKAMEKDTKTNSTSKKNIGFNFKFDECLWLKIYFQHELLFKNTELASLDIFHFTEDSIWEKTVKGELPLYNVSVLIGLSFTNLSGFHLPYITNPFPTYFSFHLAKLWPLQLPGIIIFFFREAWIVPNKPFWNHPFSKRLR